MARATSRRDISEALQKEEDQLKAEAACNAPTGNATQLLTERREAHLKIMDVLRMFTQIENISILDDTSIQQ